MLNTLINVDQLPEGIKQDIREYLNFYGAQGIQAANGQFLRVEDALQCYLEWNGIIGYTDTVIAIIKAGETNE
jgi:hypothetical protein